MIRSNEGSIWFRKSVKYLLRLNPRLRFIRIRNGFYRVFYKDIYLGQLYTHMTFNGYTHEENDKRFESKNFYEKKEDNADLNAKLSNFYEGYVQVKDRFRTKLYMLKNDKEFYDTAKQGSRHLVVK